MVPTHNLPRYNEYFGLSLSWSVCKNDMMIQMVDKPNTTPVGEDREILTFKALLYLNVAVHKSTVDCLAWCISHCSAWLPRYNAYFCC